MLRSPRATLTEAVAEPRIVGISVLILAVSTICSVAFLMTAVGQLAALDQHVRQLESFGVAIDDATYAALRSWVPYRPAINAAVILVGWPLGWLALASVVKAIGNRFGRREITLAQVLSVIVHASAVFALQSLIAAPVNYVRESLGGATSLSMIVPAFGESTVPARLAGAVDVFVLWWVVLVAMGVGMLYRTRDAGCALAARRAWVGAVVVALTQALREACSCPETRRSSSPCWLSP
jgi:hypothetical protein